MIGSLAIVMYGTAGDTTADQASALAPSLRRLQQLRVSTSIAVGCFAAVALVAKFQLRGPADGSPAGELLREAAAQGTEDCLGFEECPTFPKPYDG